mgnify:FL=1|jgi:uncharacterized protein
MPPFFIPGGAYDVTQMLQTPHSVIRLIETVRRELADMPRAADIFETCMKNTLHRTIQRLPDGTTYIITGDIPAMWLRDSAAQVRPYLLLAKEDGEIASMILGLIERQFRFIQLDPYANAFNAAPNGQGHQDDLTEMSPWIWERKYEIDSLCYPIQLSYLLWKNAGLTAQFNETFRQSVELILEVWRREQHHERDSTYRFERRNGSPTDTLVRDGRGAETSYTGMTWSGFRPSDDACRYGYLVPSNMFAVVVLRYLQEIALEVLKDEALARSAASLAEEIDRGIRQYAICDHPEFGRIYAYECDGMGRFEWMDDANIPSLLSIPYLGYAGADDPIYRNTRKFILSKHNPYYFEGSAAQGIGSPHTPDGYVWPIAIAMEGLTSDDPEEKRRKLQLLVETDGGTGMIHESFDVNDPRKFTREWFSWANMMFCELALDVCGIRIVK